VPLDPNEAAQYLAQALTHPVYERWDWRRLLKVFVALPDAKRTKPAVCRLLIDAPAVVEYWQQGRLHVISESEAPALTQVVLALLKTHKKRFKAAQPGGDAGQVPASPPALVPPSLTEWLRGTGRLYNPHAQTNTLGVTDDYAALSAFLRERTHRSRHTWRAYTTELDRLANWCQRKGLGPLSDLTRQDLLQYQSQLRSGPRLDESTSGQGYGRQRNSATVPAVRSSSSQARALAVVASLYRYWHSTGYLLGNPAAGLTGGTRAQGGFAPTRLVPAGLLALCDEWVARSVAAAHEHGTGHADSEAWRRAAIWTLFRFSGARLAELAWNPSVMLPHVEQDSNGAMTLTVIGKGEKTRPIPLPSCCNAVLQRYRLARGLPAQANGLERLPLIHGEKSGALGARGLYNQVKAVLLAVATEIRDSDPTGFALLRGVSPHWLRHAYARTLVVDKRIPLPVAQALLGHASVQTTAAYAKADLAQLREFVEAGFSP
jgi:site-specific recombinase XerD